MSSEGDDDISLSDQPEKTFEEQLQEVVDSLPPPGMYFSVFSAPIHITLTSGHLRP